MSLRSCKWSVLLAVVPTAIAMIVPASSSAVFTSSQGGEPPVTNTPTNSFFFDWNSNGANVRYCITVYRNSTAFQRGCVPSPTTYYAAGSSGTLSQTENSLPDGTLVATYPSEEIDEIGLYPCPAELCHSSTLIDLNQPVLTVFAAGTATYTNNPQVPMHIDYSDAMSQPWFAGGDGAAVYVCARRDRPCTDSDVHNYDPNCSHVNTPRLSSPGTPKSNSFDCTFNLSAEADGPVYLCATAADQSIPDPDPNANESLAIFPTHVNQFVNPATGTGWTADSANLAENSCGSVILDRGPPTIKIAASDMTPATGDLVTFSASATDSLSGVSGPFSWDFGDNTAGKQGSNITHTYGSPGTYHVQVTGHDGAGNEGSASVDVVVKNQGGVGGEGTVTSKPPPTAAIGEKLGVQRASVGALSVVAPKKHKLGKKSTPILLSLIASGPGAFQAALSKGAKVVSKGAGVLAKAGTFGFKLDLPKGLAPGTYKLRLTFVPDGATAGTTKTIPIKFFRPTAKHRHPARASVAAPAEPGAVNVEGGPPLAPGYGR